MYAITVEQMPNAIKLSIIPLPLSTILGLAVQGDVQHFTFL